MERVNLLTEETVEKSEDEEDSDDDNSLWSTLSK